MNITLDFNCDVSSRVGGNTFRIISAEDSKSLDDDTISAPALTYSWSEKNDSFPASVSTRTCKPDFIKSLIVEGVAATRGSIAFISLGIATIINVFLLK